MGTPSSRERMERVNEAQLQRVLATTGMPLEKRLPDADLKNLGLAVWETVKRYPSQDLTDSIPAYLDDFEKLAIKYSTSAVIAAMNELRIKPGQQFFPRPDEVATEIQRAREVGAARDRTSGSAFAALERTMAEARADAEKYRDDWKRGMEEKAAILGITFEQYAANKFLPQVVDRKSQGAGQ
jgi:hypothetical protein